MIQLRLCLNLISGRLMRVAVFLELKARRMLGLRPKAELQGTRFSMSAYPNFPDLEDRQCIVLLRTLICSEAFGFAVTNI